MTSTFTDFTLKLPLLCMWGRVGVVMPDWEMLHGGVCTPNTHAPNKDQSPAKDGSVTCINISATRRCLHHCFMNMCRTLETFLCFVPSISKQLGR